MSCHHLVKIASYPLVLIFLFTLLISILVGCGNGEEPTLESDESVSEEEVLEPETSEVNEVKGITITEALEKVWQEVDSSEWEVAFISNTGATQSYTAKGIRGPMEALLSPDGKAGQWVVELYKDEPEAISEGEREGIGYPFQSVLVTSKSVDFMPETTLMVPDKLMRLESEYIESFPQALKLAVESLNISYDRISALSSVIEIGECDWIFRFYDTSKQQIVALVLVSGDGQNVEDIFVGDELDELLN